MVEASGSVGPLPQFRHHDSAVSAPEGREVHRVSTLTARPGKPTLSFLAERDGYGSDVETA